MITNVTEKSTENVCNISYLSEIVGGKKAMIKGILDAFLIQVANDLPAINDAIVKTDYGAIKKIAHAMKSSVSIMGMSVIKPVLEEMETLGASATNVERIKVLNQDLQLIVSRAIIEIEKEKLHYV
ncbi:MAG: Hpt domain-containing protein [Bacteroidales bacterium]|nr:Hpt domain-containing protein [Bacteroidales bacterium]